MKKILLSSGFVAILCLCLTSDAFAIDADGWASQNGGTTGGQGGPTVTVYDEPNLIKYATSVTPGPYIVQVSGTINIPLTEVTGRLEISANKTIRGIGTNPTLIGLVDFKNRDGNIIVENLNITNPHAGSAYDGMSVKQDIYNVLVTKCTFYDTGDGQLDITNNSDFVTVSWCKFYYTSSAPDPGHTFSSLVGSSDSQSDDAANLRVTYHHNWWTTGCKERMPRVRYGQVHVYNNYYSNLVAGGYCVGVGCGSRIRVESNYFNAVPNPWADYYTGTGYAVGHIGWNASNIFYSCTQPTWATNEYATIFTPPYAYTLDDTNDIPNMVQAYAGAGTPYPPHWLFTVYGDFDISGHVDITDLAAFAGYWLTNDPEADYNSDGLVNFYEFSLLAGNWKQ
jgi:pectate lyase